MTDLARGERERIPGRIKSETIKVRISKQSVYITCDIYRDGRLAQVFITVSKRGTIENAYMDAFAMMLSAALSYGLPLEWLERFVGTRSEPNGVVEGHDRIKMCSSLHDYIARHLLITYAGRDDLASVSAPPPAV